MEAELGVDGGSGHGASCEPRRVAPEFHSLAHRPLAGCRVRHNCGDRGSDSSFCCLDLAQAPPILNRQRSATTSNHTGYRHNVHLEQSYCMVVGVQVDPTAGGTGILEAAGGVCHGMVVKSKKSSKSGCAASRLVRC